jgi:hypothetical protein
VENNTDKIKVFWKNLKDGMPVEKARELFYGVCDHAQLERIAQTDEPAGWRHQGGDGSDWVNSGDYSNCSTWK